MLYLSPAITVYFCVLAALLGACVGSFLNCMAWSIVHGEPITKGRSHCDACGHVLSAADLVPVVGFLAHRGKCRYCGEKLSKRHLWGEILSALTFVALLLKYDISLQTLEYLLFAGKAEGELPDNGKESVLEEWASRISDVVQEAHAGLD